jgi:predicted nucleic acid-binding protein
VRIVLDADIVIGALDGDDAHHAQARRLFVGWQRQEAALLLSAVNLTEVLVAPASDPRRLRAAREAIAALGVRIHQPGEAIGVEAARLRSGHPVSLPDAYCLATARHADARIVSFDEKVLRAARRERIALAATGAPRARRH